MYTPETFIRGKSEEDDQEVLDVLNSLLEEEVKEEEEDVDEDIIAQVYSRPSICLKIFY